MKNLLRYNIYALCLFIGLLAFLTPLLTGTYLTIKTALFVKQASTAQASVISLDNLYSEAPVIGYELPNKQFIIFKALYKTGHKVGDSLEILYNPEKPTQAKINSFLHIWGEPLSLFIFGCLPATIPIGFFWATFIERRPRKKYEHTLNAIVTYVGYDDRYFLSDKAWIVKCQWYKNRWQPITFKSNRTWSDLSLHVSVGDVIKVKISDIDDPRYYSVELPINKKNNEPMIRTANLS